MRTLQLLALLTLASPGLAQFSQDSRLEAIAGLPGDRFGRAVDIDGDHLVVGAWGADDADPQTSTCISGAAYVFERVGAGWQEQQRLLPSDLACRAGFGNQVTISGDTLAVASYWHDGGSFSTNCDSGAVYIFQRIAGLWIEQQILLPSDTTCGQEFGNSLAMDGDLLVVGAHRDGQLASLAGAAYVFVNSGGTWAEQQRLIPNLVTSSDGFGSSVAVSNGTILVGAKSAGPTSDGEATFFQRSAGVWTQQQTIDSGGGSTYAFGSAVAISGNTAVVAATGGNAPYGAVFVHERTAQGWSHLRTFTGTPSSSDSFAYYGVDIALDGDTLVVGDYGADDAQPSNQSCLSGAVHLYTRTGPGTQDWTQTRVLADLPACGENMGRGLALDGDTLVAGAANAVTPAGSSGAVYTFNRRAPAGSFCFGVTCPCGNDDPAAGCTNSTQQGASIQMTGSSSVGATSLRIRAVHLPTNEFAVFALGVLQGPSTLGGGLLCLGASPFLYAAQTRSSLDGGTSVLDQVVLDSAGILTPGVTATFQCIYRDGGSGSCGAALNVTNAVQISFLP